MDDPNVPIISPGPRVVMWWPTTLISCPCRPDRVSLVVTTGFQNPSACQHCGKLFQNAGVDPAPLGPGQLPEIQIQIILPTPKGEVH